MKTLRLKYFDFINIREFDSLLYLNVIKYLNKEKLKRN
jgi:hypothetical protein